MRRFGGRGRGLLCRCRDHRSSGRRLRWDGLAGAGVVAAGIMADGDWTAGEDSALRSAGRSTRPTTARTPSTAPPMSAYTNDDAPRRFSGAAWGVEDVGSVDSTGPVSRPSAGAEIMVGLGVCGTGRRSAFETGTAEIRSRTFPRSGNRRARGPHVAVARENLGELAEIGRAALHIARQHLLDDRGQIVGQLRREPLERRDHAVQKPRDHLGQVPPLHGTGSRTNTRKE